MPNIATARLHILLVFAGTLAAVLHGSSGSLARTTSEETPPTFYRDVLPILEQHCQGCHRTGGIAPMPFESYEETLPFAAAIRRATREKTMPPWFADPKVGKFSNDPSLTPAEIGTLVAWAGAKSLGANGGGASGAPVELASRGCIRSPAGLELAAARAGWCSLHLFDTHGSGGSTRRSLDGQRRSARLCAREFTGRVARQNGEICACGFGSCFSNALHRQRPGDL